jgi:hypothetical protein
MKLWFTLFHERFIKAVRSVGFMKLDMLKNASKSSVVPIKDCLADSLEQVMHGRKSRLVIYIVRDRAPHNQERSTKKKTYNYVF